MIVYRETLLKIITHSYMQKRKLGNSSLEIAPLTLGGNVFGWTIDEKRSFEILDAFTGAGFNLVDTADVYSRWVAGHTGGESETVIGNWMKQRGNRRQVCIATKGGAEIWTRGKKIFQKSISSKPQKIRLAILLLRLKQNRC